MVQQQKLHKRQVRTDPVLVVALIILLTLAAVAMTTMPGAARTGVIDAPVLKWQRGGCGATSCQRGWYNSPAVADVDNDGATEIIWAADSVFALNSEDGSVQWEVDPEGGRMWASVVVADLEGDGTIEVMTGHEEGYFHLLANDGSSLWYQFPHIYGYEIRSLAVADLEGDGDLEVLFANTRHDDQWWVYEHDGELRSGNWPQHEPDGNLNGYAAKPFNQNIAVGDVDGDGRGEIIGPNDYPNGNIAAFHDDGEQMLAHEMYGANPDGSNRVWSRVNTFEDHALDLHPSEECSEGNRANFGYTAPAIGDVNGDGIQEIILVGTLLGCSGDVYEKPFIFNADRSRWAADGFDWTVLPEVDADAGPLVQDEEVIELSMPNAVLADLDGDGELEILYASYDGRVHAFWLDKTEHGEWPFAVYDASEGFYRFASEPVVVDLDNDGLSEVLFTSWPEKGGNRVGKLYIVNYLGQLLHQVDLPAPFAGDWNGALGAPTVDNIDEDPDMEVILGTAYSGVVVYDLPGTAAARRLWPTGRGSYYRSGSIVADPGGPPMPTPTSTGEAVPTPSNTPTPGPTPELSHEIYMPYTGRSP